MAFDARFAAKVVSGPLVTYGPNIGWMYRQAGSYIGQILEGAKAAEMPVMQSIIASISSST
jgi:hypothetical protein